MKSINTSTISKTASYKCSLEKLWSKAGHPNKMVPGCIMLDDFDTSSDLKEGNTVTEVHRFAGIPQKYVGSIVANEPLKVWGMSTRPVGVGPFPLPHKVMYSFSGDNNKSTLSITCMYKMGGLLKLPIVRTIAQKTMAHAIERLLRIPGLQVI